jgi:aldose 1-epimerase
MLSLEAGAARVGIAAEVGGRLASLRIGGHELLVGPEGNEHRPLAWGCYLMAPWAGRLENGRFTWQGRTMQLPRTHGRHAIHGLVWDREWAVERADATSATLACELPAPWPMGGIVRQSFELSSRSLTMEASVTAGDAMPAAIGWHPWFARRGAEVAVRVGSDEVLETRGMIPTGRFAPVTGRLDLRDEPLLGRRRLDHAYVAATSPASIAWPDVRLTLTFQPSPAIVVVYTPPHAVCVEPQTAAPNALVLPPAAARRAGAWFLAAGETMSATFVIDWG